MRFFISSDIKKNKPLYYAVLLFLLFALLFWLASWLHFYSKYGFSKESLIRYFFVDPEFPERISLAQISEDLHVGLFLHGIVLITLFSLLNITVIGTRTKLLLITSTGLLALLYLFSDFLIIFTGTGAVFLKLFFFVAYQFAFLITWLFTTLFVFKGNSTPPKPFTLRLLTFIFGIFSLLFILSNFINFHSKMGFGVEGIKNYFLGNPELYIKPKSFQGIYKVFYPHLVSMAVYSLIVSHLLPFTGMRRRKSLLLSITIFIFSFLDNLSNLLLLYVGSGVAYVKLFSFWTFQITALFASGLIVLASLRGKDYASLYL